MMDTWDVYVYVCMNVFLLLETWARTDIGEENV